MIALTGNWILESNTPELIALRTCFPMNPLRPMIAIETLDIMYINKGYLCNED